MLGSAVNFDNIKELSDSRQVILVINEHASSDTACFSVHEKLNERWIRVICPFFVKIGRNGMSINKVEGDGKTPAGIFKLGISFGTEPFIANKKIEYRRTTFHDYWIDDTSSPDYNRWVTYDGEPKKRWRTFERMYIPLYKYGIIIKYNDDPIVQGKGSAIFIHLWENYRTPTAGCIAMSEQNMIMLLDELDDRKRPMIVIGTENMIKGWMK